MSSIPVAEALAAFGIPRARVGCEASLASRVYRVVADGRRRFLKEHAAADAVRIDFAAAVGERLRAAGIGAPSYVPARDGSLYAAVGSYLYTLTEPVGDVALSAVDLRDERSARRLGRLLGTIHAALKERPRLEPPPRPALWVDEDQAGRVASARGALLGEPPFPERPIMLEALAAVDDVLPFVSALSSFPPLGVVHGDFWPGNVVVGGSSLARLGVIDLETACSAPLLLDVAQFADLAFRELTGWQKTTEMDVSLACTFALAWARAASVSVSELAALPAVLLAARVCSILWIVERRLAGGPSPLDQLVGNDLRTIRFVRAEEERLSVAFAQTSALSLSGRR